MIYNGQPTPEPNNIYLDEFCAMANFSQASGAPSVWGWSDAGCHHKAAYICKQQRECRLPRVLPPCCPVCF
jgi:hypothetical protein